MNTKLLLLLAAAGGAAFALTRKSEEAPPAPRALPLPVVTRVNIPALDAGLSADERTAVQNAVNREKNPANLHGFAATFEPMFPVAASVLRAQAAKLGTTTAGDEPCCSECAEHPEQLPCTQKVTGQPVTMGLPSTFGVEIH